METAAQSIPLNENGKKTVLHFENGLYAFEDVKDYILLQEDSAGAIWSLQAAYQPYPSFIAVDPFLIRKDYAPQLTKEDLRLLGDPDQEDLCFLAIAVIRENLQDSVANLKSPIVINVKKLTGRQVVMEDTDYPLRYRLFGNPE